MITMQTVIYCSFIFFISELALAIAKRARRETAKIKTEKLSLILLWLSIPLGLSIGFSFADYAPWDSTERSVAVAGLLIFVLGLAIRWLAIFQLKKEFTVDVSISDTHRLNTSGLYRFVRHPSYSGLLLTCFGLSLAMNSLPSLFIVNLPILIALLYRIHVEESILKTEFGEDYEHYSNNTSRLIPKIF